MEIRTLRISELKSAPYNPRKDLKPGDPGYDKLKKSILEFDYVDPIVWNRRTGRVVGGNQRLKILREIGREEAEVSVVDLEDDREMALCVMLNNPEAQGEWDRPKLKDLLIELDTGAFDMELTGFDEEGMEKLMTKLGPPPNLGGEDQSPKNKCPQCGYEW